MEHVTACKLVQTETGYTVEGNIHFLQFPDQYFPDGVAVLVSNVAKNTEKPIFVGVPVHLPIIEDTDGSEVIHKLGNHPYLLCDGLFSIVVANSRDDQHHLVVQITVCIVENLFVARCELLAVLLYFKV